MGRFALTIALLAGTIPAAGQTVAATEKEKHPPHPIQDNSFLIEEAYNQEEGIVQHINSFTRNSQTGEWIATFTQEYPAPGIAHQLSYSIPYQRVAGGDARTTGLGDVALNYRYQLLGDDEAAVAIAPRVTLLLPTGDEKRGLGAGATGIQVSLPVSTVISERWMAHWNLGATYTPASRNDRGEKANTLAYNLGQSFIWRGNANLDLMLETIWSSSQAVVGAGVTESSSSLFISPGLRWAYNFKSGLQVVPGVGVPIGVGPSRGDRSILFYLSFEHPFRSVAPHSSNRGR